MQKFLTGRQKVLSKRRREKGGRNLIFFSKEVRVGREMERGKKKGWMVTAG